MSNRDTEIMAMRRIAKAVDAVPEGDRARVVRESLRQPDNAYLAVGRIRRVLDGLDGDSGQFARVAAWMGDRWGGESGEQEAGG